MHRAERCVQNERLERNKRLVHDGAAKFQCTGVMQQHTFGYILSNADYLARVWRWLAFRRGWICKIIAFITEKIGLGAQDPELNEFWEIKMCNTGLNNI